ncbi:MAG: type II secretion system F family protein [Candidatus Nanoarchaeia archaeon]|nr:type II secretion system F family protein [Candidatus Haiyanarchaeum thermophilum]MCW1303341.1 type II secretion system F family protein [Candidatus Haiyanarchaeum thermophilum]MCW1304077.1 type II secretion system F family protein [Candidatus Haiyanarchaeum thermophilum]MCW1306501.1 type II secretion system F family protein [Candidatus Haiyanarchaeum thermophilum]MCW1307547.1 type II secretion system F family protein [Candidatus Haiyanarchaeum thermophilum]
MKRIARNLVKFYPHLKIELEQADIELEPIDFLERALTFSLLIAFLGFSLLFFLLFLARMINPITILLSLCFSSLFFLLSFIYHTFYPKLRIARKVRDVERWLPIALRHMLVKVRSGIPLYEAMVGVANKDYGYVSKEFKRCIAEMSAGVSHVEALENMALRNPSTSFRRIIWQMANSLRSGVDIGTILLNIHDNILREQRAALRRYGSELSPFSLIYLILFVVIPALLTALLSIITTLTPIPISPQFFFIFLVLLIIFQFFFIGAIKGRRPYTEV